MFFACRFIRPSRFLKCMNVRGHEINPALVVIDMQNGFLSKGGSYDLLGMDVSHYKAVVPKVAELIRLCRLANIPIFYTQAVRERSGIDLLTRSHKILPKAREERIRRRPICVRGTWDADIIEEIKPVAADHIVVKDAILRFRIQRSGCGSRVLVSMRSYFVESTPQFVSKPHYEMALTMAMT